jgi:hypothetical protein
MAQFFLSAESAQHVFDLNWKVELTAQMVGKDGRLRGAPKSEKFSVPPTKLGSEHLPFGIPLKAVGFYRLSLTISNHGGTRLGRYARYVAVTIPRDQARLGLSDDVWRPGQQLRFWIENLGSTWVGYGAAYQVLEKTSIGWRNVFPHRLFPQYAEATAPETSSLCEKVRLGANLAKGSYRLRTQVSWSEPSPGTRWIGADFSIP